jgi:RNA polymerase sigma factor (sigma-70 family)
MQENQELVTYVGIEEELIEIFEKTEPDYYCGEEFQVKADPYIRPGVKRSANRVLSTMTGIRDYPDADVFTNDALFKTYDKLNDKEFASDFVKLPCPSARFFRLMKYARTTVVHDIISFLRNLRNRRLYDHGPFEDDIRQHYESQGLFGESSDVNPAPQDNEAEELEAAQKIRMREKLSGLSDKHFEVLWLYAVSGKSIREIAEQFDCSYNSIKVTIFRAKQMAARGYTR